MAERNLLVACGGPLLALASFAAYWASFRLNTVITPWLEYAPGASLLFLPAGVKLVALFVAGGWGVLGLGLAALLMAAEVWTGAKLTALVGNIVVWLGVPYLLIEWLLRLQHIRRDLSNLTVPSLLLIAIAVAVLGSAANSAYAVWVHGRSGDDYLAAALAMAVGDFVGQGLMLMLMMLVLVRLQRKRAPA
jgi:hypothetical protein